MTDGFDLIRFGGRSVKVPKRLNPRWPPLLVVLYADLDDISADGLMDELFAEALEAVASGKQIYWLRQERSTRLPSMPNGCVVKANQLNLINMCYAEQGKLVDAIAEFCNQVLYSGVPAPSAIFVSSPCNGCASQDIQVELQNAATELGEGALSGVLATLQRTALMMTNKAALHRYPVILTVRDDGPHCARLCSLFTEFVARWKEE